MFYLKPLGCLTSSSLFIDRRDRFRKGTLWDPIYYEYKAEINAVFFNT